VQTDFAITIRVKLFVNSEWFDFDLMPKNHRERGDWIYRGKLPRTNNGSCPRNGKQLKYYANIFFRCDAETLFSSKTVFSIDLKILSEKSIIFNNNVSEVFSPFSIFSSLYFYKFYVICRSFYLFSYFSLCYLLLLFYSFSNLVLLPFRYTNHIQLTRSEINYINFLKQIISRLVNLYRTTLL